MIYSIVLVNVFNQNVYISIVINKKTENLYRDEIKISCMYSFIQKLVT